MGAKHCGLDRLRGRVLQLKHARGPKAAARTDLENSTFETISPGKIAAWENAYRKVPNILQTTYLKTRSITRHLKTLISKILFKI